MMRCFSDILHDSRIPDNIRQSVYLQTVSLETVYSVGDTTDITRSTHLLRQLCLSVYTQAMRPNNFNNLAKTLTGFGPASAAERYLKSIDAKVSVEILCEGRGGILSLLSLQDQVVQVYKHLYCPPFILAPPSQRSKKTGDSDTERSTVSDLLVCLPSL